MSSPYTIPYSGAQIAEALASAMRLPSSLSGLSGSIIVVNGDEDGFEIIGRDIPDGFSIVFNNAAVPTGYSADPWSDNVSLIIGPTYGSGNAAGASPTSWQTELSVGEHALTEAEMYPHAHSEGSLVTDTDTHGHTVSAGNGTVDVGPIAGRGLASAIISVATSSDSHGHGVNGATGSIGSGVGHDHPLTQDTYDPKYQIMITGTRAA
ncbi:hypothetical protein [Desulfospira joergensenii]|uniref:hypothetical protein n=1 Tax=Desulfospira joergensenii TaxID=53329 RepID=UPI0003B54FA0|nr:hypothetical protein [Desulfospira joergensenii]